MTYLAPTAPYSALGLTLEELILKGGPAVQAASKIVEDPHLPEMTCQVLRLNAISRGVDPGKACARTRATPEQLKKGVGLGAVALPLRIFVAARERPVLVAAAGIGVVGALLGVGYLLGRRRKGPA